MDFLGLQKNIDRNKIGIIGICGFGGMALNATAVDKRVKAVATTSMYDMSRVMSKGYNDKLTAEERAKNLETMSRQRWEDAASGTPASGPRNLPEKLQGNEPQFVVDYFNYYRTPRGFHERSVNSNGAWLATNAFSFMNMPLLTYIKEIYPRPILIIAGSDAHSRYFSEDAYKAAAEPKELMIIPHAVYNALNELLVYMNFNSRGYINYFTKAIAHKINLLQSKAERIDSLQFHYKEFRQMQYHQRMILYPQHKSLKAILSEWFEQEIAYVEKTIHLADHPVKELKKSNVGQFKITDKILVGLSTDQIALILRAADESRLLTARSMSEVFKKIVPYLSTPSKEELSFDSVRSKSYVAEDRDKQHAVTALEKMIAKIKSY